VDFGSTDMFLEFQANFQDFFTVCTADFADFEHIRSIIVLFVILFLLFSHEDYAGADAFQYWRILERHYVRHCSPGGGVPTRHQV